MPNQESQLIFLWGMPGSGKTTLGIELSERLERPFVDLDQEVEAREGISPSEMILKEGEEKFRIAERDALKATLKVVRAGVFSTGGGTPTYSDNAELMQKTGLTIYLKVPAEELVRRLAAGHPKRPLLASGDMTLEQRVHSMLEQRAPLYETADLLMEGDSIGCGDIMAEAGLEEATK